MNHTPLSKSKLTNLGRAVLAGSFILLGLTACSNEAIYQSIQQDRLRACEEIPIFQQPSCKAQYQKDYATYKRERDALKPS